MSIHPGLLVECVHVYLLYHSLNLSKVSQNLSTPGILVSFFFFVPVWLILCDLTLSTSCLNKIIGHSLQLTSAL